MMKAALRSFRRTVVFMGIVAGLNHLCVLAGLVTWESMWPYLLGMVVGDFYSRINAARRQKGWEDFDRMRIDMLTNTFRDARRKAEWDRQLLKNDLFILRMQCKRAGLDPETFVQSDASLDEAFDKTERDLEAMERAFLGRVDCSRLLKKSRVDGIHRSELLNLVAGVLSQDR
jgi:hypothetical protein